MEGPGGLEGFKSQALEVSNTRQARPQAVAKALSVKSTQSDQRSVQLRSVQDQPVSQAQFPVLVSQGQGHRLGRPVVVRLDVIDSLFIEDEFSIIDNEAVLKEEQAHSEVLDKVAEFCNQDRQDPQIQKEVMGIRLPAYNAPAKKSIKISLPWHSSAFPTVGRIHGIHVVRGRLDKFLKPRHPASLGAREVFSGTLATIPITGLSC